MPQKMKRETSASSCCQAKKLLFDQTEKEQGAKEKLSTEVSNLPPFNCILQKGTEFLSQDEHHCASSRGNMDKMVKSYDPCQFTAYIKKPNAVRALPTTYPDYLKITKKLEQK